MKPESAFKAIKNERSDFQCKFCKKLYQHAPSLSRHQKNCKVIREKLKFINSATIYCESCKRSIKKQYLAQHQRSFEHLDSLAKVVQGKIELFNSSLNNDVQEFRIKDDDPLEMDVEKLFSDNKAKIIGLLELELAKYKNLKFQINHCAIYRRISSDTDKQNQQHNDAVKTLQSAYYALNRGADIADLVDEALASLVQKIEEFKSNASGWTIALSLQIGIQVLRVAHFGTSYIELPVALKKNRNLINVMNPDSLCIIWCILCHLYQNLYKQKNQKIDYRNYLKFRTEVVTKGLEFPLSFREIKILEELNTHLSLSINIYDFEDNHLGVVRTAETEKQNHINLLLIYDEHGNGHYVYIKNLHRFVRPYLTSVRHNSEFYFCPKCLSSFKSSRQFEMHEKIKCLGVMIRFPPSKEVKFNREYAKEKHYLSFIADFETFNLIIDQEAPQNRHTFTQRLSKHQPLAAGYKIQSVIVTDDYLKEMRIFTGSNCLELFIKNIVNDAVYFYEKYLRIQAPITPLNSSIEKALNRIDTCYVCNKSLNFASDDLALDHLHLNCETPWLQDVFPHIIPNSNLRQYLHTTCNLKFKTRLEFYIIMHNYSNFDALLILRYLLTSSDYKNTVNVIPRSQNNFISASFTHLHGDKQLKFVFIDSLNHLSGSLANLTSQCSDQLYETKKYLKNIMPELDDNDHNRFKKLPQCYDHITSIEMCNEIRPFPNKECFKNNLNPDYEISQEDYNFAKSIYDRHCTTLMNWIVIYLRIDLTLLYDLFLYYRRIILNFFHLDPVYFFSAPQLSYNIMLDLAGRSFEIITDTTMLSLIFKNIRAGVSYGTALKTYANNQFCKQGYNPKEPYVTIIPTDVCSLYSYVLSENSFPIENFEFIFDTFYLSLIMQKIIDQELTANDPVGYLIVCKITLNDNLHNKFDTFPLFPERKYFPKDKCYKLVSTLETKDFYLTHALYAQLGVKLGYNLERIYYAISFKQEKFLAKYLHKLQHLREINRNVPFLSLLFKLLANCVYGKSLESIFKRRTIKFYSESMRKNIDRRSKSAKKHFASPNLKSVEIITEDLVALHKRPSSLLYNKLNITGLVCLELSKLHLSHLIYTTKEIFESKNNGQVELLLTDTDSAYLKVSNIREPYKVLENYSNIFNLSTFPRRYNFTPSGGTQVPGKLSYDIDMRLNINSIYYIRPKAYILSLYNPDNREEAFKKRAKGVQHRLIEKLTIQDFQKALNNESVMIEYYSFIRHKLEIFNAKHRKVALRVGCLKRMFTGQEGGSKAWGNYAIRDQPKPYVDDILPSDHFDFLDFELYFE